MVGVTQTQCYCVERVIAVHNHMKWCRAGCPEVCLLFKYGVVGGNVERATGPVGGIVRLLLLCSGGC